MPQGHAARLRGIPSLTGVAPAFQYTTLPTDPVSLFRDWLGEAIRLGVPEPLAMTVSTVDAEGMPDARILILKDFDERGWAFAAPRTSAKGAQLAAVPAAALTFWWQPIVRSVRLRGTVREASRADSRADFDARDTVARAHSGADEWTLWRLEPSAVEFWQGSPDRQHTRVRYTRTRGSWTHIT